MDDFEISFVIPKQLLLDRKNLVKVLGLLTSQENGFESVSVLNASYSAPIATRFKSSFVYLLI